MTALPDTLLSDAFLDDALLDDALLNRAAETYGTPLYLYDLGKVTAQVAALREVLPHATLLYAVKANPNHAVLETLASLGLGAEVITLGELVRAVRAGIPPEQIFLGGPRQDRDLVARAVELGVGRVSLDSVSQWRVWREVDAPGVRFLPRVNPGLDPRTHEHLATGAAESKFGMTPPEAAEVAGALAARGQLGGFHVHAGSQISDLDVYDEIFAVLEPLYERFEDVRELDVGGGFVVPGFDLERFAEKVSAFAERYHLTVTVEPGRFLVAAAGVLLSRVLHVKSGALHHVVRRRGHGRPAAARALRRGAPASGGRQDGHGFHRRRRRPPVRKRRPFGPRPRPARSRAGRPAGRRADRRLRLCDGLELRLEPPPAEAVVTKGELKLVRKRETVDDLLRLELD